MNLAAWQKAWQGFNGTTEAEGASRLVDGCSYRFDAAKLALSVTLGFDPKDATYSGLKQGEQVLNLKR
jgi:hypothetical protein